MKYLVMVLSIFAVVVSAQNDISEQEIHEWIKKLGSNEFKVREQATEKLVEIGEQGLSFLREAENHSDPEVSWRATQIIKRIVKKQPKKTKPSKTKPFAKEFEYKGPGFRFKFRFSGNVDDLLQNGDWPKFLERRKFKLIPKDFFEDVEGFQRQWEGFFSDNDEDLKRMRKRWQGLFPQGRRQHNKRTKAFIFGLKLQKIDEAIRTQLQLKKNQGILVKEVSSQGRFSNIGLKKWDLILEVNGEYVTSPLQFKRIVDRLEHNQKNIISIIRRGKVTSIEFVK
ncbi:hypothetical protein [Candidatus Uabimicrobium sp. HlEnr_7]|uniref:hypothetical protein n=1 Tax=Candidatus Uabimicrobium helgolandensis TaxID=3095367 RepID=UPI0035565DE2